jgi:type VI secretion system protein ImpL
VVYAERATERIGDAYRNLVQALATHRTEALSREHNAARLGNVYEFPRELGKLRSAMVKFLVDVCRPSQLRTAPFLRGFYFAGVRPIVLDDRLDVMAAPAPQPSARDDVGATRIFRSGDLEAAREKPAPRAGGGRKVPQWTFVSHFFSDVLLKDAVAQGASGASVKTSALRRFALAGFALVLLIVAVGTTVSYFGNRGLENDVLGRVQAAAASAGSTKTLDTLTRLDSLRQSIDELREQEEKGAPFRLRWTLYSGRDVLAEGRKQYFKIFDRVLLDPAQDSMVSFLKGLPPSPGPASDYSGPYDTLKAYLITTSNHEQSTPMFLSPILLEQWSKNAGESAEITELAQKQFDFYATELKAANPLSAENDRDTIGNARRYLGQFDPVERVYRAMLAEATQKNPAIRLSTRYPKSAEVLVSNYEVSGAFTKGGFLSMSASLKNADRFFAGEEWVLGDRGAANVDAAKLEANLRTRYTTDFIQEWRAFLDKSAIARYADPADGARKLNQLAGNQSPLLGLLSIVSDNTSVDSEDIKKAFQPAQLVTPAGSAEKLIGESNGPYMGALLALQAALEQVANGPKGDGSDVLLAQAAAKASEAKVLTRQVAQNFRPDPERRIDAAVQKLLEDPISNAEGLVRSAGPGELNGKGRVFCGQIQDVMSKYPFTPTATKEATLQDLSSLFSPKDGALWSFYKSTLSKVLIKQGNQYVDDPSGSVRTTPAFREYWNRVAIFTDVMFPANAKQPQPQPKLAVTLKLVPNKSVNNVRLSIEGKNLSSNGSNPSPMVFTWTGSTQSVTLIAKMGNSPDLTFGRYDGFWGPFRFFADAEKWDIKGSTATFERILRQGAQGTPLTLQDGTPVSLKFELDSGASPIFHKGFMSGLRCVSEIARP